MLAMLFIFVAIGTVAVRLVTRQLPPGSGSDQERRLAEQAEQIELLEDELRRVKEQAEFTEKLLTDRGDNPPDEDDSTT